MAVDALGRAHVHRGEGPQPLAGQPAVHRRGREDHRHRHLLGVLELVGQHEVQRARAHGILGLGAVGLEIARRAALGFGMEVSYHNRQPRDDVDYTYCASAVELARNSDFLVLATPGGVGTYHLIDRQALDALGPHGYLVNIGRGSVVVTADLVAALEQRRIGGAALDVFDDEPQVPDALKRLGNTVLTSHVAGLSPEAAHDTVQRVAENLVEHFAGRPVLTPVALPPPEK